MSDSGHAAGENNPHHPNFTGSYKDEWEKAQAKLKAIEELVWRQAEQLTARGTMLRRLAKLEKALHKIRRMSTLGGVITGEIYEECDKALEE